MWPESGLGGEWGWGIVSPEATCCGLGLMVWQMGLQAQVPHLLTGRPACLQAMAWPCPPHPCCSSCRVWVHSLGHGFTVFWAWLRAT